MMTWRCCRPHQPFRRSSKHCSPDGGTVLRGDSTMHSPALSNRAHLSHQIGALLQATGSIHAPVLLAGLDQFKEKSNGTCLGHDAGDPDSSSSWLNGFARARPIDATPSPGRAGAEFAVLLPGGAGGRPRCRRLCPTSPPDRILRTGVVTARKRCSPPEVSVALSQWGRPLRPRTCCGAQDTAMATASRKSRRGPPIAVYRNQHGQRLRRAGSPS